MLTKNCELGRYVFQAALAGVITVGCGSAVGGILYSSGYKCMLVNGTEISYGNQLYGYAWLFIAVLIISALSQVHLIQCKCARYPIPT